jgi:hypothetical protein
MLSFSFLELLNSAFLCQKRQLRLPLNCIILYSTLVVGRVLGSSVDATFLGHQRSSVFRCIIPFAHVQGTPVEAKTGAAAVRARFCELVGRIDITPKAV